MPTIQEVRSKYPQYSDLSDDQLAQALHKKYYSDLPYEDFSQRIGLAPQAQPQVTMQPPAQEEPQRLFTSPRELKDAAIGAADVAISGLRGLVNKPAGTLVGLAGAINPNDTYLGAQKRFREAVESGQTLVRDERLRTPQGEAAAAGLDKVMRLTGLPQAMEFVGGRIERAFGPETRDVAESAAALATLRAPSAAANLRAATPAKALTAEDVLARTPTGQSAGAAAAATNISGISQDLRKAVVAAGKRGDVSPDVVARHVQADTLPVPIRLTAGEATGDPVLLSQERNLRGKHPEMVERMSETNQRLGQNLSAMRDQLGPEVFSTNMVEHGDALIRSYRARDAAAEADINAKYKALRDANGGQFPIDAKALLASAAEKLHAKLLFDHAPASVMNTLNRLAENGMTFENFEALRTNLARIQRSADGNEAAAAGVIRQALEELPLGSGAAQLKPLADAARAAARQRFQALEADPAYKAAVLETVPPDNFVRKFIINAPRDQVATMMKAIENDPVARQTVSVAVLDYLRDAARLNQHYEGNFSSAGFSKALAALDPKANLIFDARTAETLGNLRDVANYTTVQPRGSFVNNSNTLVGSAAKYGGQALEGAANVAAGGVPVGTWGRALLEASKSKKLIQKSLEPGAGIKASQEARRRLLAEQLRR